MTMITETTKLCSTCGLVKPEEDFEVRKSGNRRGQCKPCRYEWNREYKARQCPVEKKAKTREYTLKYTYGMTLSDYAEMLDSQGGHCAICPTTPAEERSGVLFVDHNHDTDEVRGLLCNGCNSALGMLKDSPRNALSAAQYLLERGSYSK